MVPSGRNSEPNNGENDAASSEDQSILNPSNSPENHDSESAQTRNPALTNAPPTTNFGSDVTQDNNNEAPGDVSDTWQPLQNGFSQRFTFMNSSETSLEDMSESFAERIRHYLQQHVSNRTPQDETNDSHHGNTTESNTEEAPPGPPPSTTEGMNLFDEILDTVLGQGTNAMSTGTNDGRPTDSLSENSESQMPEAPNNTNGPISSENLSNVDGATVYTTGGPGGNPGAIVITVNYVFMDGSNEPAPGRTGSLVVTIPNNATNREPHIISSFISLATRMAYSALIHGGPKPKPGISLEKFQSFKSLNVDDLTDKTCAICFEQYERSKSVNVEDLITTKRRKLSPTRHEVSASATPEPSSSVTAQIERENPPSTQALPTGLEEENQQGGSDEQAEQKVHLCDHEEEFDHSPLQMPCNHVFGRSCLAHWLKDNTNCPLCRLSVADPGQSPARSGSGMPPISFIRFGGLGDLSAESLGNSPETSQQTEINLPGELDAQQPRDGEQTSSQPTATSHERPPDGESGLPRFLRRATSVLFNQSGRRNADAPAVPLGTTSARESRERNPSFSPVINNIQNYFRRARRRREADTSGSHSLFTSGVSSRRTPNGVETTSSDDSAFPIFAPAPNEASSEEPSGEALSENPEDHVRSQSAGSIEHSDERREPSEDRLRSHNDSQEQN